MEKVKFMWNVMNVTAMVTLVATLAMVKVWLNAMNVTVMA
jgi:hypothetical protein